MIYGHMVFNSLKNAKSEIEETSTEVICYECGEITELKIQDYGFADDFGGVSDYRVETKCCGSPEWLKGCSSCGELKPLKKKSETIHLKNPDRDRVVDFWYCEKCLSADI